MLLVVGCASSQTPHSNTTVAPKVPAPVFAPERQAPKPAEDSDGLEVRGTLGILKETDIEQVFKSRFTELLACVTEGKEKFRYLSGAVDIKVKVDQRGATKSSFLQSSTLGHREAETCLEKIVAQLRFAPPQGGKEAEFNYPIDFGSSSQVLVWEGARIKAGMVAFRPHVRACKRRVPGGLPPGIQLTVYVGPGGRVLSAGVAADAPVPTPIGDCLIDKTRLLRLDDPLGQVAKATVGIKE